MREREIEREKERDASQLSPAALFFPKSILGEYKQGQLGQIRSRRGCNTNSSTKTKHTRKSELQNQDKEVRVQEI